MTKAEAIRIIRQAQEFVGPADKYNRPGAYRYAVAKRIKDQGMLDQVMTTLKGKDS